MFFLSPKFHFVRRYLILPVVRNFYLCYTRLTFDSLSRTLDDFQPGHFDNALAFAIRRDAPLPRLTLARERRKVLPERVSTKGGALTLKTALPARNAGFIVRPRTMERQNESQKKRITCQLCRCGVTQEEVLPARGFTSPIPESDAFLTEAETSPRCSSARSAFYQARNLKPVAPLFVLLHRSWSTLQSSTQIYPIKFLCAKFLFSSS